MIMKRDFLIDILLYFYFKFYEWKTHKKYKIILYIHRCRT